MKFITNTALSTLLCMLSATAAQAANVTLAELDSTAHNASFSSLSSAAGASNQLGAAPQHEEANATLLGLAGLSVVGGLAARRRQHANRN